jgi:hypothetical protein
MIPIGAAVATGVESLRVATAQGSGYGFTLVLEVLVLSDLKVVIGLIRQIDRTQLNVRSQRQRVRQSR